MALAIISVSSVPAAPTSIPLTMSTVKMQHEARRGSGDAREGVEE